MTTVTGRRKSIGVWMRWQRRWGGMWTTVCWLRCWSGSATCGTKWFSTDTGKPPMLVSSVILGSSAAEGTAEASVVRTDISSSLPLPHNVEGSPREHLELPLVSFTFPYDILSNVFTWHKTVGHVVRSPAQTDAMDNEHASESNNMGQQGTSQHWHTDIKSMVHADMLCSPLTQLLWPTGFPCGWPIGLEFPAEQLGESGYWQEQFQTSLKMFLFATYWCIQRIRGFTTMHYINWLFTYLVTPSLICNDVLLKVYGTSSQCSVGTSVLTLHVWVWHNALLLGMLSPSYR